MASTDDNHKVEHARWGKLLLQWLGSILAALFLLSVLMVLSLRWINPPTSSFMLQRQWKAWRRGNHSFELHQQWVGWSHISWTAKMAAITSEDQRFPYHWGIDFQQVKKAIKESKNGEDLRGASTITQQTAKNLFLWPAHSFIRKGIEAYFAVLMELLWSKQRILEVYLNIAQFGDSYFGVQAAAHHYFKTTAAHLTKSQSALMVVALPSPDRYNLAHPSAYMIRRQHWNLRYMRKLGGRAYLRQLK